MVSSLWLVLQRSAHNHVDLGAIHKIGAPIQVYPLYENGFRAHRGQSVRENHEESAKLYAQFEDVAEKNVYAWNQGQKVGEQGIAKVSGKNRMICFPCEYWEYKRKVDCND